MEGLSCVERELSWWSDRTMHGTHLVHVEIENGQDSVRVSLCSVRLDCAPDELLFKDQVDHSLELEVLRVVGQQLREEELDRVVVVRLRVEEVELDVEHLPTPVQLDSSEQEGEDLPRRLSLRPSPSRRRPWAACAWKPWAVSLRPWQRWCGVVRGNHGQEILERVARCHQLLLSLHRIGAHQTWSDRI